MTEKQMNMVIAKYEGAAIPQCYTWDRLMPIAKKLSEISRYQSVSFTKNILDFDIEKVTEAIYDYINWLNKN